MGIPQVLLIVLWTLGLIISIVKHGQPTGDEYNAYFRFIAICIQWAILYAGGFFG